jgi:hypothetical protein
MPACSISQCCSTSACYPESCSCPDINEDGEVNVLDLQRLAWSFGKCAGEADYNPDADLNGDGCVDCRDLTCLADNFLKPASEIPRCLSDPDITVPEFATSAIAVIILLSSTAIAYVAVRKND